MRKTDRMGSKPKQAIIRKAKRCFAANFIFCVLWNLAIWIAVEGYGRLFHLSVDTVKFKATQFLATVCIAFVWYVACMEVVVNPYSRKISGKDYYDLVDEDDSEGHPL